MKREVLVLGMVPWLVGQATAQPAVPDHVVPGYETTATVGPLFNPYSPTNPFPMSASPLPNGAALQLSSGTGTTASVTAGIAAAAGAKSWLCGFSIIANATGAATGNATVTGLSTTLNFTQWVAPLASGVGSITMNFRPCLPTAAVNTNIFVNSIAAGSGGTTSVTAWGYQF